MHSQKYSLALISQDSYYLAINSYFYVVRLKNIQITRKKKSVDNYQNTHGRNDKSSAFQEGKLSQTISNLQYQHPLPFPQKQITNTDCTSN